MLENLFNSAVVACDTETTGLSPYGSIIYTGFHPARPFAFSFTNREGENEYVRFEVNPHTREVLYRKNPKAFHALKRFFATPHITKVFHNAMFDLMLLRFAGIEVKGPIMDTKILAHAANSSRPTFRLKPLCASLWPEYFGVEDQQDLIASVHTARRAARKLEYAISEKSSKGAQWFNPQGDPEADYWLGDSELCATYAVTDTDRTMALYIAHEDKYNDDPDYREIVDMEHTLIPIALDMAITGHRLDHGKVLELEKYYAGIIAKRIEEKKQLGYGDLNPASPLQMKNLFFGKLKCPPEYKRRKRKDGVREETLTTDNAFLAKQAAKHPIAKCLLEINAAQHQLDSFIVPFKENAIQGILHPNFNTCGPVTGRLSCSNPNLMNITSKDSNKNKSEVDYRVRECFVPRDGHLLYYFDYSQIEIWILAFSSGDPLMVSALLEGVNMHTLTANNIYGNFPDFKANFDKYRKSAKIVNFAIPYGGGPAAIAVQAGCTYDEARLLFNGYWNTYKGVKQFNDTLIEEIARYGFTRDQFGRCYFLEPNQAYKALNYRIQGPASTVMKRAMIEVAKLFATKWKGCRILLSIHDELVMEIPMRFHCKELVEDIIRAMQNDSHTYIGMPKPFIVEPSFTTTNWLEKKALHL